MLKKVESYIRQHALLQEGDAVLVACSGGADSLALLDMLLRLRPSLGIDVQAAHFEHGIRGEASRSDATFVENFCRERGIPFFLEAADIPALARARGISLELAAREARYDFLWRVAGERTLVATAHHQDDQAETLLMRLLRGTGTDGLAGIRPRAGRLIRPLLAVTRQEIVYYCRARGLSPRQDATNEEMDATRNRIRHTLLPLLREENPSITQALATLSAIAGEESDFLEGLLAERWPRVCQGEALCGKELLALPLALQRRALRRFWRETATPQDLDFHHVESLLQFLATGKNGALSMPRGFCARVSYGYCRLARELEKRGEEPVPVTLPGVTDWGDYRLTAALSSGDPDGAEWDFFMDGTQRLPTLCLRARQPGDEIAIGSGRMKKIKDVFIDAKLPREERASYPLLATEQEILWVPGIRRSAHFPAKKGNPALHFHLDRVQ